jgi:hypothetical protein
MLYNVPIMGFEMSILSRGWIDLLTAYNLLGEARRVNLVDILQAPPCFRFYSQVIFATLVAWKWHFGHSYRVLYMRECRAGDVLQKAWATKHGRLSRSRLLV